MFNKRTLQNRAFLQIHSPRKHSGLTKIPGFAKPSNKVNQQHGSFGLD